MRIIIGAIGGLLGFAVWYTVVSLTGLMPAAVHALFGLSRYAWYSLGFCVCVGYVGALDIAEKRRLIPTQEPVIESNDEVLSIFPRSQS